MQLRGECVFAQHHATLCSDVSGQAVKLLSELLIGLLEAGIFSSCWHRGAACHRRLMLLQSLDLSVELLARLVKIAVDSGDYTL